MVEIKKRIVNGNEYFYLEHSFRAGKKVKNKSKYLGKELPSDIDKMKKEFISQIYKDKWFDDLERIKNNYNKSLKALPKSAEDKENEVFGIKFTYDSQRIEGSTLTLKETADLIERGITPTSKPIRDVKEAETHNQVFKDMLEYKKDLNLSIILDWHKKLLGQTKEDIAGKVRTHQVAIARSKFMPPMHIELEFLLKEFFDWYNKNKASMNPVELAALVHLKFVSIHPFSDGNGRMSRIMMNFILKKNNYPLLNISYSKRTGYYNALERANMKKDQQIFTQWFFRRYLEEHKKYLKE